MPASEDDLMRNLAELGIATETVRHPPVFTVEESKALRGDLYGAHTKNLFLKDKKGQLWLVVALEDRVVDLKDLRHRISAATLSFGRPELLVEALGVEPGSVTPFAVINDPCVRVQVVLDAGLLDFQRLNFHPLTNAASTTISPDGLMTFLRATGHEPALVRFPDAGIG